jgi:hypothetical protein
MENASTQTVNIDAKSLDFEISELEARIGELNSDIVSRKMIAKSPKNPPKTHVLKICSEKETYTYSSKLPSLRLCRAH